MCCKTKVFRRLLRNEDLDSSALTHVKLYLALQTIFWVSMGREDNLNKRATIAS